jgi:transmembrane sensor
MNARKFDDGALARYLSAECAPEEARAITVWLDENAEHHRALDAVRKAWEAACERSAPRFDVAGMRARIAARTGMRATKRHTPAFSDPFQSPRQSRWLIVGGVAAALAIAAIGVSVARRVPAGPMAIAEQKDVATRAGQRADVYLSDGTHVLLAPASRLRFASPFTDTVRVVRLEGEAMFDVKHDALRPFIVRTQNGVARDLGTRFAIRQYPGDADVRVVVAEGSVALDSAVLKPGDVGLRDSAGGITVERVDIAKALAWTQGRLTLEAVPLREAIPQLDRWYDLEFLLSDPDLGARRLTASFSDEPADEVVRVIATSLDVRFERRGRTVTFKPKRSKHEH